jgi:RNA polymerase sigma-70 factor (ECF subfamily)
MATPVLELIADDDELLARARQKDREAIRLIIRLHNRRLYRIARSIVRDDADAEDVLQEAYVRAFTAIGQFRGEARVSTWLARIVINEALGCIRRRRPAVDIDLVSNSPSLHAQIIPFPGANRASDPETAMVQTEIRTLLERAIDKLPPAFRRVLIARLVEGMSVAETAELFEIDPQTVKTRLFRARALLRTEIERHIGPTLDDVFPFAGERCESVAARVLTRLGLP